MPSASQLRIVIERQLSQRIPAALSPAAKQYTALEPTGILALDKRLGGFPVGALTEVTGIAGSGRTALAQSAISAATHVGQVVAWVDVTDAFDPAAAAANGVLLDRLLWVRCGHANQRARTTVAASAGFQAPETTRVQHGGGSPHPRSEERGLPQAVQALLTVPSKYRRDRVTGTPGAVNRPLAQASVAPRIQFSTRIEQAGTDRQPSRRGTYVLEQRERFATQEVSLPKVMPAMHQRRQASKPWHRVDDALRVTDLLLQAGGFRVVVLDLADIAAEYVSRIPIATWFRFRAGAEHAQSVLLVLTQHASTGSSAGLVLKTHGGGVIEDATYFPGLQFAVEVVRERFPPAHAPVVPLRKPPQRADTTEWHASTPWSGRTKGTSF